jgi:hypothetical protein
MKPLLFLAVLIPLCGQDPPKPDPKPDPQTPAATPAPVAAPAPAETPVPSGETWFSGTIDLGYRFRTNVAGSMDTYRSVVNLGEGPKLIGLEFTLLDPKHRAFDQVHVQASSFGDEPYSVLRIDAKKSKWYDFRANYRDIALFDVLPSYADPLLARGIVLDQQSFDTRRRFGSFQLDLLPGNWIVPYLAFDHDSGSGTGATTFVSDGNDYPVPNTLRDQTNLYRGGVRIELRRFHITLEQGGTTFKNDQSVFQNSGTNLGDVNTPVFGQTLSLSNLLASYGIRGHSVYSKVLFTGSATSWLDLYGQFLYSQPQTDVHYTQTDVGNLFLQSQILFFNSEQYLLAAAAKLPHTTGSFGAEIRPFKRVRILESWMTDRLHNASSATSSDLLSAPGMTSQTAALLASTLVTNYNQQEIDVLYDATPKLTVRGGYRYVWGDANDATLPAAGLISSDSGKIRRHIGLGGLTYRPNAKLVLRAEAEIGSSGSAYFRTSLYDYQKVRAQARYQLVKTLSLSGDFTSLNNQDSQAGIHYDYLSTQESLTLLWTPKDSKTFALEGTYTRSSLRSDIMFLTPQDLSPQRSLYRDNSHIASGIATINLPKYGAGLAPKITAGGSLFISSGSRPTNFYQPVAKLWLPVNKHVSVFTEWRYYGYGEAFYLYESFRTHLVTTGLRFTR